MIIRCLHHTDRGHATFLLGHERTGEAILIDPADDVIGYLAEAERLGLRIRHVFAADYGDKIPFGLLELREQPGVRIHQSDAAPFVCDAAVLRPEVPLTVGLLRIVLVRDARGAESFAVHDLEGGGDCLALATWPAAVRRSVARHDPGLADTA